MIEQVNLKYLITVIPRESGDVLTRFFHRHEVTAVFTALCSGTAKEKTLDYLGLEKTEKAMQFALIPAEATSGVMRGLIREVGLDAPDGGIALTIPVNSVGGADGLRYLTGGRNIIMDEVREMDTAKHSLIIVIAERGGTDAVMDAARSAGAGGGTVVHAKGTGKVQGAKFFGMSIADEKELIFIVVRQRERSAIMRAIMDKAGMHTPTRAALLSMPVDEVVGLRSVEDDE